MGYVFPSAQLGLLEVCERVLAGRARAYIWQPEGAFDATSLPAVQIDPIGGSEDGPERSDAFALTAWTAGDLQEAIALLEDLLVKIAEEPHATAQGLLDYVWVDVTPAPVPTDVPDVARATAQVSVDTRATAVS